MRQLRWVSVWQVLVFCLWSGVPISALVDTEGQEKPVSIAELKEIPDSIQKSWSDLDKKSLQNPEAALEEATIRLRKAQKKELFEEELYGRITVISIMVRMETIPEALVQIDEVLSLVHNSPYKKMQGLLLALQAEALKTMQQFQKGLRCLDEAEAIFKEYGYEEELGGCLIVRGQILFNQGHLGVSLKEYLKAYEIFKRIEDDVKLASVITSIASVYDRQGQHEKAVKYYREAMDYIDPEGQKMYYSILAFNVGVAFSNMEDWGQAETYLVQAQNLSEVLKDQVGIAYAQAQLGRMYLQKEMLRKAETSYLESLIVFETIQDSGMVFSCVISLASVYAKMGNKELSHRYLDRAMDLGESLEGNEQKLTLHEKAADLFARENNFKNAFEHQSKYLELLKKKNAEEREQALQELQMTFQLEQEETKNQILLKENELKEGRIRQHKTQKRYLIVLVACSLLILFILLYAFVKQVRIRKRFVSLAMTDELTKAPNRRNILEFASLQFNVSQQTGTPLLVAMIDLDFFKSINDQFGHDVGDRVLQAFFKAAKGTIRGIDRCGRIGGEEWLIVMPGVEESQVASIFKRLRDALNQQEIAGFSREEPLTFSMGVAMVTQKDRDLARALRRADEAVYRAKSGGRDRWCS